jgi:uncharacterized protein YcsI (UPF0317 family)
MVPPRHQLPFGGKAGQRFFFPDRRIPCNPVQHTRRQHEKAAVDPAPVAARFFLKSVDAVALGNQRAIAARRLNRSDRGVAAMIAMKLYECADVDIGQAIAVGQAEIVVVEVIVASPVSTSVTRQGSAFL